jgi:hypothetical protein
MSRLNRDLFLGVYKGKRLAGADIAQKISRSPRDSG